MPTNLVRRVSGNPLQSNKVVATDSLYRRIIWHVEDDETLLMCLGHKFEWLFDTQQAA